MNGFFSKRFGLAVVLLAGVIAVAGGVGWYSFTSTLGQLEKRGRADLALATDRLSAEMRRYRELAVFLSDHPVLTALVNGRGDARTSGLILRQKADQTGTEDIRLLDAMGNLLATAGGNTDNSGDGPAFRRAMNGALGSAHYVNSAGQRLFTFGAPVFGVDGPSVGAIMVSVDLSEIEWNWPSDPFAVFFTDERGVVFLTSRSELILARRGGAADAGQVREFPPFQSIRIGGHDVWNINGGRYLPEQAMHLIQPVPVIGMTGEILIDTAPARRIAYLQGAVTGALMLALWAMLYVAAVRRQALADRLETEAAANAKLEKRVATRTAELSATNQTLRRAQADLVQADKLKALGQMSAGISHELNQPLMAIRSFAENAQAYLARGAPDTAAENLSRISELARRMGRIIKNLRAFARQEHEEIGDVELVGVVDAVLELSERRLLDGGVVVEWERPIKPVIVRGGEVRLQQVVMNLVSNAADAMVDSDIRRLRISIAKSGGAARLQVTDTGPGIDEPGKIFDPFYTTKVVGKSEGMGLGLSISYGLVQSFGGVIRGRNIDAGGAEFTVELTLSSVRVAA
ncbi:MAG: C4-dicarboxylate ABC transporter [Marinosulfonomonas sp.]|nr:MAG: C4-dicarboxylate ABC transporter [Marinosulfonomonas sp.]